MNKIIEELKELPRKTINGCWYIELGSVETLIRKSLSSQQEEFKKIPIGVSQWRKYGKKYGYDSYFKEEFKKMVEEIANNKCGLLTCKHYIFDSADISEHRKEKQRAIFATDLLKQLK